MDSPAPALEGEDFHYLVHVLRKKIGDRLVLFGFTNQERVCAIRDIDSHSLHLEVLETRERETESKVALTLAVATGKGKKLEEVVEAATALGIRRIVPFVGRRSVSKRENPRLPDRLQSITVSASRQSGRMIVPAVSPVLPDLKSALDETATNDTTLFHLDEAGGMEAVQGASRWKSGKPAILFCGPEGGWADEEREALREAGAVPITLGPRILRTELAAIIAVGLFERLLSDRLENPDRA
jgi:16S rRNA (uracil1498-N3)-methyltransferase